MDNSQYLPPRTEYSAELYEQIEQSIANSSPEKIRAPFQGVDDAENLIDSFHETSIELEQANGHEVKLKYIPVSFSMPARSRSKILNELINAEGDLGGELYAEKNRFRFWYGGKSRSTNGIIFGNWYIEDKATGVVTHIETHPNHINKFNHNGQRVEVTLSDLEIFIPAVYHYVRSILKLYPFEAERADVILDGLELPDNIEALLPPQHNVAKNEYGIAA